MNLTIATAFRDHKANADVQALKQTYLECLGAVSSSAATATTKPET